MKRSILGAVFLQAFLSFGQLKKLRNNFSSSQIREWLYSQGVIGSQALQIEARENVLDTSAANPLPLLVGLGGSSDFRKYIVYLTDEI